METLNIYLTTERSKADFTVGNTVKFGNKPWGSYFSRALFEEGEGLIYGEKLRFIIDWASRIVGSKFTAFALFYFVFEDNFSSTSPRGAYIWRGDLTEGLLRYRFGRLIFGGAYTWRGLFSEFTV